MLPVSEESCGGAEQMLWTLEAEMARRGRQTVVAACEGSRVAGTLFATGAPPEELDRFEQRDHEHAARTLQLLARRRFDLVHDKSGGFWRHAGKIDVPVLATLHLPRSSYPAGFDRLPPNLHFNCVSAAQLRDFAGLPGMLGAVTNGIHLPYFPPPHSRREPYLLWLGRICEEKGTHLAIQAAHRAARTLVIAGEVYPFSYHRAYFDREIRPHLDGLRPRVHYVGPPKFSDKLRLLRRARALLLPSLVDETSSLVAMEAMACGTPVVAFRRGAIPEIVEHGVTGLLVDSPEEMADAVQRVGEIDPRACRARVEERFTARRMAVEYESLYESVLAARLQSRETSSAA